MARVGLTQPLIRRPPRSLWLTQTGDWLWSKPSFRMVPDLVIPFAPSERARKPTAGAPRIAFAGFPSDYSLAFLLSLLEADVELVGLVTSLGANPAIVGENALSQIADHLGIPLLRLARVNEYDSIVAMRRLNADLFLVASFDQILHERALRLPALGWLNVHPSLLPKYRGPEPVYWALVNGEEQSGVSMQRLAREIDAGPLILQRSAPVLPDDTAGTLTRRLCQLGAEALGEGIGLMLRGAPGTAMELATGSYYTSVRHERIDRVSSALVAERMVRAGNPNMLAAAQVDGRLAYVLRARLVASGGPSDSRRLHFQDGDLLLEETEERCGCHHAEAVGRCPHDR